MLLNLLEYDTLGVSTEYVWTEKICFVYAAVQAKMNQCYLLAQHEAYYQKKISEDNLYMKQLLKSQSGSSSAKLRLPE